MAFQARNRWVNTERSVSARILTLSSMVVLILSLDGCTPSHTKDTQDANDVNGDVKKSDGKDVPLAWQVAKCDDLLQAVFRDPFV